MRMLQRRRYADRNGEKIRRLDRDQITRKIMDGTLSIGGGEREKVHVRQKDGGTGSKVSSSRRK